MTTSNPFQAEAVQNFAQKCCVALVVDTSTSMVGSKINQLNSGIQSFIDEISADAANLGQQLEIGIITFDSTVQRVHEPKLAQFIDFNPLQASGSTALVDGVREGIQMARDRKQWYKQTGQKYFRPWVIMMTDGEPDSSQADMIPQLAAEIENGMTSKEFCFLALGVEGADEELLQKISSSEMTPRMLKGLKFAEFFKWLSATIGEVAKGQDVASIVNQPGQSWDGGFKI